MTTEFHGIVLEKQRGQAMRDADAAALDALFDERLEYVHSSGLSDGRDTLLGKIRQGDLKYLALNLSEIRAVVDSSDLIVLSGVMRGRVHRNNETIDVHAAYVAVWQRIDGAWKFRYFQSTKRPTA